MAEMIQLAGDPNLIEVQISSLSSLVEFNYFLH